MPRPAVPLAIASYWDRAALLGTPTAPRTGTRRGEDQPSMRKFMASSWWKQITAALGRGLRGHPLAAAAVAREPDALEEDVERAGAKGGPDV